MRDEKLQYESIENDGAKWTESALLVWILVAAAFSLAAFCLLGLAWDGSYFMLQTLQSGVPFMPAHRWFHWVLLEPVLWMRPLVDDPAGLSVVHGLMCALPPLFSLGVCLAMLRGKYARLRVWVILGILLVPLPGQSFIVTEIIPAIQLAWILFVFGWLECPRKWSPAVLLAMGAMATLHPAAVLLFLLAAVSVAIFAFTADNGDRRRMLTWAVVFAVASVIKLVETMLLATPYERANMSATIWFMECASCLLFSPFLALVPIFIDMGLFVWSLFRPDFLVRSSSLSKKLWAASFILGLAFTIWPGGWSSAINYRKLVLVVTIPTLFMAGLDAWRQKRGIGGLMNQRAASPVPLIYPTILFVLMLSCISLSWRSLCGSLMKRLDARRVIVMTFNDLPKVEAGSALNHWSTTSLSIVLQGWSPKKLFIWDSRLQLTPRAVCICPGDEFPCEDKAFKLSSFSRK